MARKEERQVHWLGGAFGVAAAEKVGTVPREHLRWLACKFANYSTFKPEETAVEISVFIVFEAGPGAVHLGVVPPFSAKRLMALGKEVREGLERFVDGGVWELNLSHQLVRRLSRQVREFPPDQGAMVVRSTWSARKKDAAAFRAIFLLTAHDLLAREGERLARCQFHECKSLFVKDDPREKYCSDKHASADRQYRYRTGRTIGETK